MGSPMSGRFQRHCDLSLATDRCLLPSSTVPRRPASVADGQRRSMHKEGWVATLLHHYLIKR